MTSLTIRNFVLIEDATLEFKPGLNVLTGETGTGKTLLTRALGLLMGERAEDGLVGRAAPDALVQAVFTLNEAEAAEIPAEVRALVGEVGPGDFIVSRRLGKGGRNRCFLNDTAVTLGTMSAAVGGLLSFAGQHEYRRLLDPRYQLTVLDQWAGGEVVALAEEFRGVYAQARAAARRLEDARSSQDSRLRELELLRFQVTELAEARLSVDEEEVLVAEQRLLARAEEVLRGAGAAATALSGDSTLTGDGGGVDAASLLAQAGQQLSALAGVDPQLDAIAAALTEVQYQTAEIARDLHSYVSRVLVDPERLATTNERLKRYTDLARKYGGSTEAAVEHLAAATERLAILEEGETDLEKLEEARAAHAARALALAAELGAKRRQAAPLLEQAIAQQLGDLGMPTAELRIALESALSTSDPAREGADSSPSTAAGASDIRLVTGDPAPGTARGALDSAAQVEGLRESGAETIEFLLVANPGQPPRNLARTASGGELSRVLLAIKCALAGVSSNETLVFDEIDAGIGGRTAVAVGNKLRELAARSQLIVVTHLAQVAALATQHYLIDKVTDEAATVTRLSLLTGDQVVEELCRMLGGRPDDVEALAHARELRGRAAEGLLD